MKLAMHAAETDTVFTINFDFNDAGQRAILKELQDGGYKLLGYKGASGPNQVGAGLPTWFAEPFTEMFGKVEIDYTPMYKVYVFDKAVIGANTTIKMEDLSDEVGLGTSLIFNQDGSFSTGTAPAPIDSITITNNTAAGSSAKTVGLAAKVGDVYLPFCAFTSNPQGATTMTPHEDICLFAAQTSLKSGSVTAVNVAPGCEFSFSASAPDFNLAIQDSTFQVISAGAPPVTAVPAGSDLAKLLNNR